MGTYLVLADRYAEEIRNDERFSAYDALVDVCINHHMTGVLLIRAHSSLATFRAHG